LSNIARYADRRLAPVALLAELDRIIDGDRFPLSPRIQILKGLCATPSGSPTPI